MVDCRAYISNYVLLFQRNALLYLCIDVVTRARLIVIDYFIFSLLILSSNFIRNVQKYEETDRETRCAIRTLFSILEAYFYSAQRHELGSLSLKQPPLKRSDSTEREGLLKISTYHCFYTLTSLWKLRRRPICRPRWEQRDYA